MKEPFMKNMFPKNYMRPWERDYQKRTENVSIFSHYEKTPNDSYDGECEYCGREECRDRECEEYEENDPEILAIWESRKKMSEMTLQDIIDRLPEGVSANQVKFNLHIDVGDMSVYGAGIDFYYAKDFPDDPEGFEAAEKQYQENYKLYEIEKAKYDQWVKEQKIKDLEDKLAKLKK